MEVEQAAAVTESLCPMAIACIPGMPLCSHCEEVGLSDMRGFLAGMVEALAPKTTEATADVDRDIAAIELAHLRGVDAAWQREVGRLHVLIDLTISRLDAACDNSNSYAGTIVDVRAATQALADGRFPS